MVYMLERMFAATERAVVWCDSSLAVGGSDTRISSSLDVDIRATIVGSPGAKAEVSWAPRGPLTVTGSGREHCVMFRDDLIGNRRSELAPLH